MAALQERLAHTDFEFARYLSLLLGHTLAELVEVPVRTWFVLEIICLVFWQCELRLPPNARLFLWIVVGYATCAVAFCVHAKLRLVLSADQPEMCEGLSLEERRMVIEWKESTGQFAADGGSLAPDNPRILSVPAYTLSLRKT